MNSYRLHELHGAPVEPGVYAWYYRLEIAVKDIEDVIARISAEPSTTEREASVRSFLADAVFASFIESPYRVELTGPLKPRYSGEVTNHIVLSRDLAGRFASEPQRLKGLAQFLRDSVPHFASPIYIGVATSLKSRLLRHKQLIDQYREAKASVSLLPDLADDELRQDHSFAKDVVHVRRFVVSRLVAYTMTMAVDPDIRVHVEHILNRLNFPLCGRL